jgi:hypothetical protein
LLLILSLAAALSGCTFKHVVPEVFAAPTQKYSEVVVGEIAVEDTLWESLVPHFRRGLVGRLNEKKVFDKTVDPAPASVADSAIRFAGKITEVDKGSTALRWIVGFGAGRARVSGVFEIRDARDQVLARLEAKESYAGGAGIGGAGFLDMEDLMRRFGETMAEKIIQWSRGEKLE